MAKNIGSWFHKMIDGWKQHYELEPVIEGDFDYFKITFPRVGKRPPETTDKTTDKTADKTTDKALSDMEKAILDLVVTTPSISQKEMAEILGLSVDGIRYHTDKLKNRGVIKRVGGKKTGRWEVLM